MGNFNNIRVKSHSFVNLLKSHIFKFISAMMLWVTSSVFTFLVLVLKAGPRI